MAGHWDAIVVGSGIGGLTTAVLLARLAGMKVLVLEKHTERGGQTHVFRRDGAAWDVGLHYVGNLQPGTFERKVLDFLSGGELRWNRMTDDFERFVYPDFEFRVPSDPARYEARLIERFPDEAAAIRQWFRDLRRAARWYVLLVQERMMPAPLARVVSWIRRRGNDLATRTTGEHLDRTFRSPQLKALLASQWGDYGLTPKDSAFALHALVATSYFNGAWFPEGGAGRIARTFERAIEAVGGAIRVGQEVTEIVVRDGRAVGVRVLDRRGAEPIETIHEAPVVVSDVGARRTYETLLPTDGDIGRRTEAIRSRIAALDGGVSAVTLYVRLKVPAATLGVRGENLWINADYDHDDLDGHTAAVLAGEPRHAYLSFPSAKSGDDRFHTAEIITMLRPEAFDAWRGTETGARDAAYGELKDRISAGLLRLVDTAVPGFSAQVAYGELSTPLTVEHYTSHPQGRFYGLPGRPERYRDGLVAARTPIDGLHLTGCDVASLGILGATMGGLAAASGILGATGFLRVMTAIGRGAAPIPARARSPEKRRARLVAKSEPTPTIRRLDYELDAAVDFTPGQYVKLRVAPYEWRDYSIADLVGTRLTLLVSNRTGGDGSRYVDRVTPGEETEVELPFGAYRLRPGARRRVFVATGTGLAPFLPMFRHLARTGEIADAELYFGCATPADDLTVGVSVLPAKTVVCTSRAAPPAGGVPGRVTDALTGLAFDAATTDFHVCGSAAMVADCRRLLSAAGALRILTEPY
jgi:phytoene dehydrogenase-like protein/NAD(P)H-flavin reductase